MRHHVARLRYISVQAFIAFCLVAGLPIVAAAQEDLRSAALEEVIVTAQKREESLQDAPLAVSAFTADDMERFGVIDFGDAADLAPNMTLRKQTASHSNYAFGARGVASGETALAIDSVVGLYLDGVYVGRLTGSAFDIADAERVEVLRGPQGTLYGRNTVGGAINVIANKPASEFSFRHSFSGGERGFLRNQTTINSDSLSLLGGELAGRVSFARWDHDGLINEATTQRELGDQDSEAWKFALRWDFGTWSADYSFDRSEKQGNSQVQQVTGLNNFGGLPLETFAIHREAIAGGFVSPERQGTISVPFSTPEISDVEGHALTLTWDSPWGITFKSITAYRDWKSAIRNLGTDFGSYEYDGATPLFNAVPEWDDFLFEVGARADGVAPVVTGERISLFRASRDSEQEQVSQEFQFSGNLFADRLKYVAGLYYFHERADEANRQTTTLPGSSLPFLGGVNRALDSDADPVPFGGSYFNGRGSGSLCGDPGLLGGVTDLGVMLGAAPAGFLTIANACYQASVVGGSPVFNYGTDNDAYAAYLHGEYAVTDQLNLTVGIRYTEDERAAYLQSSQSAAVGTDAAGDPIYPVIRADDSWTKVTWDVAVDYQWSSDINVYGRVATSYRAGGYNARATAQNFATPFDQEDILSYEVGAKTQWFADRLRLNLTVFIAEYEDTQTSAFSPSLAGSSSVINNAGEQTNEGVELEILAIPVTGLTFGLNYGYVNAEYDEYPLGASPNSGPNAIVPYAPENTASGWGEYQFPALDWGQLSVWVGFNYSDGFSISPLSRLSAPTNDDTQRTLWDARLTLSEISLGEAPGDLRIALWGRNLYNKEYREFVIPFGTFDVASYGELRSAGLEIVYEF